MKFPLIKFLQETVKFTAGGTFLALASLLIGLFLPHITHAAYIELQSSAFYLASDGYWTIEIPRSQFGITPSVYVSEKFWCTGNEYNNCANGAGANSGMADTTYLTGFSSTSNETTGDYYYLVATYQPNNSFECSTKDCYYLPYHWDNVTKTPEIPVFTASSSRIISLSPSGNATTSTSTSQYLEVYGYILPTDFATGTVVTLSISRDATTQSVDSLGSLESYGLPSTAYFEFYPTVAGEFTFSTTTDTSDFLSGRYSIIGSIQFPLSQVYDQDGVVGLIKSGWSRLLTLLEKANGTVQDSESPASIIKSDSFIIGALNYWDLSADEIVSIKENLGDGGEYCAPLSGDFSILGCLQFLFIPNEAMLTSLWSTLQQQILSHAPFGYVTRFIAIASGITAEMPVPLSYTYGTSAPPELQGLTIEFQIYDHFDVLNSIESDDLVDPKNIWEITMPFFEMIIGLGVLGVILYDLMQIGIPMFSSGGRRANDRAEQMYAQSGALDVVGLPDQRMESRVTYSEPQNVKIKDNTNRSIV